MMSQSKGPAAGVSGRKDAKGARGDGIQVGGPAGAMQQAASGDCLVPAVLAGCNAAQVERKLLVGVVYDTAAGCRPLQAQRSQALESAWAREAGL